MARQTPMDANIECAGSGEAPDPMETADAGGRYRCAECNRRLGLDGDGRIRSHQATGGRRTTADLLRLYGFD